MNTLLHPLERHPWQPFIHHDSEVLILGTFPPKQSRWAMEFYYPNRINDFWRIIGLIFHNNQNAFYDETSKQFNLDDIKRLLLSRHIAIGDSALEVRRLKDNASDKYLEIVTPLPLNDILLKMPQCHTIVSTGEKAAQVIAQITGTTIPPVGSKVVTRINSKDISHYRMPSTSRAYPLPIKDKADFYRNMFQTIGIL